MPRGEPLCHSSLEKVKLKVSLSQVEGLVNKGFDFAQPTRSTKVQFSSEAKIKPSNEAKALRLVLIPLLIAERCYVSKIDKCS